MPPICAVSFDIDTLASLYKGRGCHHPGGYTYAELHSGLETIFGFLEPYHTNTTMFMVGQDMALPQNQEVIRTTADLGHEIANHTHSHPQGFRFLPYAEKEKELVLMEEVCFSVIGKRPIGFRAPGWNTNDELVTLLKHHDYVYDSSVFPTYLTPLLKYLHWYTMRSRNKEDRTTLGLLRYMVAPNTPYRTNSRSLLQRGRGGIIEFPITVTPMLRFPFFGTTLLSTPFTVFKASLASLRISKRPIQFQLHLTDFVDFNRFSLYDQISTKGQGQYIPLAMFMPIVKKLEKLRRAMDLLAESYEFMTLAKWAEIIDDTAV